MARPVRSRSGWLGAVVAAVLVAGCGSSGEASQSATPILPTPSASDILLPTEAPTPAPSPTPEGRTYVVRKGDVLITIAAKFHVTLAALRAANPEVTDPRKLQVGQKLLIPAP